MNRALFLDRDGVLDHLVYYESSGEWEAPRAIEDVVMTDGVLEPLEKLADAGWLLFVVTNQPSYAKAKVTREALEAVHAAILAPLPVTRSYVCFHHPEAVVAAMRVTCDCRKPGTRFLREAAEEFDIDLRSSWMVGDQDSDLLCGRAAGCRVALLEHPGSAHKRGAVEPDVRVESLQELAEILLAPGREKPAP